MVEGQPAPGIEKNCYRIFKAGGIGEIEVNGEDLMKTFNII